MPKIPMGYILEGLVRKNIMWPLRIIYGIHYVNGHFLSVWSFGRYIFPSFGYISSTKIWQPWFLSRFYNMARMQGRDALRKAQERSKKFGEESEKMSAIAREARTLAEQSVSRPSCRFWQFDRGPML
jgi:hypothetical protein